jgi:hypothetical protein
MKILANRFAGRNDLVSLFRVLSLREDSFKIIHVGLANGLLPPPAKTSPNYAQTGYNKSFDLVSWPFLLEVLKK